MTESIDPHYRAPRTQSEARIDGLTWDGRIGPLKPIWPRFAWYAVFAGLLLTYWFWPR